MEPNAMSSPLAQLRQSLPALPARLRQAGRYIVEHDFDAATRSMRDLAAAAGLQPASFTRLAQALGHAGWDEFRNELIEARRPGRPGPFSERVGGRAPLSGARLGAADMTASMMASDVDCLAGIDTGAIERAAKALHEAPRIWVAGFRSCRSVAVLLHYQLRLFRPDDVRIVGGMGPEDCDFGAFRPEDALVVIGFTPYSSVSVLTRRAANEAGCTLVAIADRPAAPIAEGAHHLLLFDAGSTPAFFPSLTGALAIAQALAAAIFVLGGDNAAARLREAEARIAALSQYVPDEENSR
jgi:DNA-binding MurR/RpiR family transcriptional regulator